MLTSQMFMNARTFCGTASGAVRAFRAAKHATTAAEAFKLAEAGAGEACIGVFTADADDLRSCAIAYEGEVHVLVNAASVNIAAGDKLNVTTGAIFIKADNEEEHYVEAMEPAIADGVVIKGILRKGFLAVGLSEVITASATPATITAAQLDNPYGVTIIASVAGVQTINLPSAASAGAGARFTVIKTGSAGDVTLTPAAGTIDTVDIDATGDTATFIAVGTVWVLGPHSIA